MKTAMLLNIVLVLALVVVCVKFVANGRRGSQSPSAAVYGNIMTRNSVRAYLDRDVEDECIDSLLHAGMAAPSAVNRQPWHFVVVKNRETLARMAELTPNASMAKGAPLAIVVCGDMDKYAPDESRLREYWVQDASAATENILLQAHAMGLGAVWTGTYPMEERCQAVSTLLELPPNIVPFYTIVVGYPAEEAHPKDKWKPENVSFERFGQAAGQDSASIAKQEKAWADFNPAEQFQGNPFTYFSGDGLLLAAGDRDGFNEMTIGWGALGHIWEPGASVVTVYVAPGRYTHGFMEKTKYFTVMEFDDAHKDVLAYMGSHSGRDGDKVKALGLHTLFTENGTPYFDEASAVYECEMIYHAPLDPRGFGDMPQAFYKTATAGIHSMYMGKIVRAMRKK